jgi:hypothetical protein
MDTEKQTYAAFYAIAECISNYFNKNGEDTSVELVDEDLQGNYMVMFNKPIVSNKLLYVLTTERYIHYFSDTGLPYIPIAPHTSQIAIMKLKIKLSHIFGVFH